MKAICRVLMPAILHFYTSTKFTRATALDLTLSSRSSTSSTSNSITIFQTTRPMPSATARDTHCKYTQTPATPATGRKLRCGAERALSQTLTYPPYSISVSRSWTTVDTRLWTPLRLAVYIPSYPPSLYFIFPPSSPSLLFPSILLPRPRPQHHHHLKPNSPTTFSPYKRSLE